MNKQILKWFVITILTFGLSLVFTCNIVNLIKNQNITINIISILVSDNNIIIGSIIVFILTMLVIINYSIVIQNSIRKGNLKSAELFC